MEIDDSCMLSGRMKDIYVADLASFEESRVFDAYFLVLSKQQRMTKASLTADNVPVRDDLYQAMRRTPAATSQTLSGPVDARAMS